MDLPDEVVEPLMAAGANNLVFNAPLSEERAHRLIDGLAATPVESVVDLGCGNGELARLAALRLPGAEVLGIDLAPERIERATSLTESAGLADRVRFQISDAADWPGPADAALCVAASHAFGGTVEMLTRTGQQVPRGSALIGEGVWTGEPDAWCIDTFGELPMSTEALVQEATDAGWTVLESGSSTLAEWDEFEAGWAAGVRAVGTREARAFAAERELEYGRYRGVLGFGWLLLRR